jgi:hypothetical protein
MKHHESSPEDMADLLHHRATLPAAIWALLLVAACVAAPIERCFEPQSLRQFTPAPACAAQSRPAQ